jgi:hypothetical protein
LPVALSSTELVILSIFVCNLIVCKNRNNRGYDENEGFAAQKMTRGQDIGREALNLDTPIGKDKESVIGGSLL